MKTKRFALMHREEITDHDGNPYLIRLRIFMTPLVSLYRHQICQPDHDRCLHDHPFPFVSLITSGGYLEEIARTPKRGLRFRDRRRVAARMRWRLNVMTKRKCHRISMVVPETRTLVLIGPRRSDEDAWGFWEDGAHFHTPWREYLRRNGHPQAEER